MPNLLAVWPKLNEKDILYIQYVAMYDLMAIPKGLIDKNKYEECMFLDKDKVRKELEKEKNHWMWNDVIKTIDKLR